MTSRPLIDPHKLAKKSAELLASLADFAQTYNLYDLAQLTAEEQKPIGEFYDYRLGMEPVFRISRIYRDYSQNFFPQGAESPTLNRGLFRLNKELEKCFSHFEDVEPMGEHLGEGRLHILLFFGFAPAE